MQFKRSRARRALTAVAVVSAAALALTACNPGGGGGDGDEPVELTVLVPNFGEGEQLMPKMVEAFEAENPNVTVSIAFQPGGTEGSNLVMTKLATGEMEDAFFYIGGSLMHALNPDQTLRDLSDQPWVDQLAESFVDVVTTDNGLYSTPMGTAQAGVVLYNKPIYEQLGLEVPTDWASFMENNRIIQESGVAAPVVQTYGDPWTAQLFILGDYGNIAAQDPSWAQQFTDNKAKNADQPALQAWLNMAEVHAAGFFNENFPAARLDDGLRMVATGEGAHYPMLTGVVGTIKQNFPDDIDNIGAFAIPAQNAADTTLTMWPPNSWFIPKTTEGAKLDAALAFLEFVNSDKGCEIQNEYAVASGPYVISSCTLPAEVAPLLLDLQAYFDDNRTSPALEFLSPVKGPNLPGFAVEVGSGIRTPEEAAALYDEDVKKQAQQLGLPGW